MKRAVLWLAALFGMASAAAGVFKPGSEDDPRVRAAQFLAGNGRYLSAATLLERVQAETPQQRLGAAFYRELADVTLNFGMPQRAELIYREQIAHAQDPVELARARLRLADFYYQRGYYEDAASELNALRQGLPKTAQVDWQDLMSRVLLAQGRYGEAAAVLELFDDAKRQTPYMRYNYAVALIKQGRVGQGLNVLDRVGQLVPTDSDTWALRDKANLTLAYYFLRTQQGGTAIPIFERVRTQGPYSTRALLGLGWAFLAPGGSTQKKVEVGDEGPPADPHLSFSTLGVLFRPGFIDTDIYKRAGLQPFRRNEVNAQKEAAFKRALVPWVDLINRDPMDPAVQEGMLAIPYALDQLGAHLQAQQFYERAIAALEQTRSRLQTAMQDVKTGRMVATMIKRDEAAETGWTWKLKDLPDAPETFYLQILLSENRFQEGLKNFRDLRLLQNELHDWKDRLLDLQHRYISRNPKLEAAESTPLLPTLPTGGAVQDMPTAPPKLQLDQRLTIPGGELAPRLAAPAPVQLRLAPAPAPQKFDGPYERMLKLQALIDQLLPKLAEAERAQGEALQALALADLKAQDQIAEKYLADARLALARIYDQRPDSGKTP